MLDFAARLDERSNLPPLNCGRGRFLKYGGYSSALLPIHKQCGTARQYYSEGLHYVRNKKRQPDRVAFDIW